MLMKDKDYRFDDGKVSFNIKKWIEFDVPNYKIRNIIGAGANGVTLQANHELTDREVVIKVWIQRSNDFNQYCNQFLAEIKKIAKLSHPNIVAIHDANIYNDKLCWAVYDFVAGESLREWLGSNPSKERRMAVARSIFETTLFYQRQGILHGDLHDRNILIDDKDKICIIDFGTSKFRAKEKSLTREICFMLRVLHDLLEVFPLYNEDHFLLQSKHSKKKMFYIVDKRIRHYCRITPYCLSETILNYINILEELTHCIHYSIHDIVNFCSWLTKASYLDIYRLIDIYKQQDTESKFSKNIMEVVKENIGEDIFPETPLDGERMKQVFSASLIAYLELANKFKPSIYTWLNSNDSIIASNDKYSLIIQKEKRCARKMIAWYLKHACSTHPLLLKKLFYKHAEDSLLNEVRTEIYMIMKQHRKDGFFDEYMIVTRIREILCMGEAH